MHTKFNGSNGQNAHRWLRTIRYEYPRSSNLSAGDWLGSIDGVLEGDAALWADHHPRVKHILRAGSLQEATRADVEIFKTALRARFPPVELTIGHVRPHFYNTSAVLVQAPNEDLDSYYQRNLILLYQKGGVDLAEAPLTEQEHEALKATISTYIQGLKDIETQREVEAAWMDSKESLSLCEVHKLSKEKKLAHWLREEQTSMRARLPGHIASNQTPSRANVESSNSAIRAHPINEAPANGSASYSSSLFGSQTEDTGPLPSFLAQSTTHPNIHEQTPAKATGTASSIFNKVTPTKGARAASDIINNETPSLRAGTASNLFSEETPTKGAGTASSIFNNQTANKGADTASNIFSIPDTAKRPQNPPFNFFTRTPPEIGFTSRVGNFHYTPNKKPTETTFGNNKFPPPPYSNPSRVQEPPYDTGFTSRFGKSYHTPNSSNGSNPPTTVPTASIFGGAIKTPTRNPSFIFDGYTPKQGSIFEVPDVPEEPLSNLFEQQPTNIFEPLHPFNRNGYLPPAYQNNNEFFGNGSVTGANGGRPKTNYFNNPRPSHSLFEPGPDPPTCSRTGGLFSGSPQPGKAGNISPIGSGHSRARSRATNLEVDTHLPPSRLSEDTVRQFYSPGRGIFGNFSKKNPSGLPSAFNPTLSELAKLPGASFFTSEDPTLVDEIENAIVDGAAFLADIRNASNSADDSSTSNCDPSASASKTHPNTNITTTPISLKPHHPPSYAQTLNFSARPLNATVEHADGSDGQGEVPITIKQSQGRRKKTRLSEKLRREGKRLREREEREKRMGAGGL